MQCWMLDEWNAVILCTMYVFHFTSQYTHIVLNGMWSSGEILGMMEPLHCLIRECSRTSKHWSKELLGSSNVYCCSCTYGRFDRKGVFGVIAAQNHTLVFNTSLAKNGGWNDLSLPSYSSSNQLMFKRQLWELTVLSLTKVCFWMWTCVCTMFCQPFAIELSTSRP